MSSAAFRELAREALSPSDAAALDYCTLDPTAMPDMGVSSGVPDSPGTVGTFVACWKEWERSLRLNLARSRAQKLKRDAGTTADAPGYPIDAAAAAKAALAMESPLEAELFLDKARWDAIESFQGIDTFSENAMFAYLLKLLLLERRAAFNTEEGFTEYKGLYAAILGEPK
jgi:hypothetical protein